MSRIKSQSNNLQRIMGLVTVGLLFLTLSSLATANTLNQCIVPIASIHFNRIQWPLIYKSNGELYPTQVDAEQHSTIVNIPVGAEATLSCGPNYLRNFNRVEVLNVKCESGNKFSPLSDALPESQKALKSIEQFGCDLRVVEEVISPVNGCTDPTWTAVTFGYVNPQDHMTHIIGEACYDEHEGRTIFAHIKIGDIDSYLQQLPKDFLVKQRHPDGRYKSELFRGLHFDEIYERIRQTLHLKRAPFLHKANYVDDFFLSSPQFHAVKKLGWNYFVAHDDLTAWTTLKEDIVAHQHAIKNGPLHIYVGSHGKQVLHGANGEQMELYLQPEAGEHGKFPVPELLWIVVKEDDKSMAFGVYNDATLNAVESSVSPTTHTPICESKCGEVSWLSETAKKGGVICCSVSDFRKVVKEVPAVAGEVLK